jgi:hypothetical protein
MFGQFIESVAPRNDSPILEGADFFVEGDKPFNSSNATIQDVPARWHSSLAYPQPGQPLERLRGIVVRLETNTVVAVVGQPVIDVHLADFQRDDEWQEPCCAAASGIETVPGAPADTMGVRTALQ